jgi:iron complex outermembrane receptor protein
MVYVKTATGFRGGGQNSGATSALGYAPFKPENDTEYEVGMKGDFFQHTLRVDLAAFYDDDKNIQRSTSLIINGASVAATFNAAAGTVKGLELELTAVPTDRLTIGGTLGLIDAVYSTFTAYNPAGALIDRTGEKFPGTPPWTVSVYTQYATPLTVGSLVFRGDYDRHDRYQSTVSTPNVGLFSPTGGELNGRITLKLDNPKLDVALYGRNLTNSRFAVAQTDVLGINTSYYNNPRTYGIEARYAFGGK